MTDDPKNVKWHPVGVAEVKRLTENSPMPGVVFPVGSNAVPPQLHAINGVVAFYASSYSQAFPLTPHLTAGGEYAAVRHDGDTAKAYNFIFASSSDGQPSQPLEQLTCVVADDRELPRLTSTRLRDRDGDAVCMDIQTDESYVFHGWARLPLWLCAVEYPSAE